MEALVKSASGGHDITSMAGAVKAAATGLAAADPDEIAVIASGRMTNEELFLLGRLADALGVPRSNLDCVPRFRGGDDCLIADDRNPNTEGVKAVLGIAKPGSRLKKIRDGIASGAIKTLLAWNEDLVAGDGDAGFTSGDLAQLRFLVFAGILANPTADAADVVLPTAAWAEKSGSMINITGRLQRLNAAISPPGDAGDDWEVLRDLGAAAGGGNGLYLLEDVFKQLATSVEKFAGLSLGKIGDLGVQLYETGATIPLLARERERRESGVITG
jgi:NADH-quinone oxidoreductase subunit G